MTINLKQPKYIIPLLALPFLILFFYVYQSSSKPKKATTGNRQTGINSAVGEVSDEIKKKDLDDKLDAYRNTYKDADGYTAVSPVPVDKATTQQTADNYSVQQKKMLDSINNAMRQKFSPPPNNNQAMIAALNHVRQKRTEESAPPKDKDPMDLFLQQMAIMDSLQKANDPEAKAEAKKKAAEEKLVQAKANEKTLAVTKANSNATDFNTLKPDSKNNLIMAVIDENVTGYVGSRIRLRLLEDIEAGGTTINKGTYLYAFPNKGSRSRSSPFFTRVKSCP